jgi:hypothetical protein
VLKLAVSQADHVVIVIDRIRRFLVLVSYGFGSRLTRV